MNDNYMDIDEKEQYRQWIHPYHQDYNNSLLTREIHPDIIKIVNNDVQCLKSNLEMYNDTIELVDKTFGIQQYLDANKQVKNTTGIMVGVFDMEVKLVTGQELAKINAVKYNKEIEIGYEIGYFMDKGEKVPIFEIEEEIRPDVERIHGSGKIYYYFDHYVPDIWVSEDFGKKPFQTYIFICGVYPYLPLTEIKFTPDEIKNYNSTGHVWLTSVYRNRLNGEYITNIFDTNSTHEFNFQYARMISFILENYQKQKFYLPIVDPRFNMEIHVLNCQNDYYSDVDPNYNSCLGLQNRDIWGLCQTFISIMYLVLLRNPELASENFDLLIRKPGINITFYSLKGLIEKGKEVVQIRNTDTMEMDNYSRLYF